MCVCVHEEGWRVKGGNIRSEGGTPHDYRGTLECLNNDRHLVPRGWWLTGWMVGGGECGGRSGGKGSNLKTFSTTTNKYIMSIGTRRNNFILSSNQYHICPLYIDKIILSNTIFSYSRTNQCYVKTHLMYKEGTTKKWNHRRHSCHFGFVSVCIMYQPSLYSICIFITFDNWHFEMEPLVTVLYVWCTSQYILNLHAKGLLDSYLLYKSAENWDCWDGKIQKSITDLSRYIEWVNYIVWTGKVAAIKWHSTVK